MAGTGPSGSEELEQKLMHLRRVNESLVERVEFFERSQVTIDLDAYASIAHTYPRCFVQDGGGSAA